MTSIPVRGRPLHSHPYFWVGLVGLFFVLVVIRLTMLPTDERSAIWPANGILAAGLLFLHGRRRIHCAIASVSCALLLPFISGNLERSLVSMGEAWMIALLAQKLCGSRPDFSRARTLAVLLVGAIIPACLVSAGILYLTADTGAATLARDWFISHALGAAIFIPVTTMLLDRRRYAASVGSTAELGASLVALAAAATAVFFMRDKSLVFLVFPMLMLVTVRHGPLGSASGSLLLTGLALVYIYGFGTVADPSGALNAVQWIQMFLLVALLTSLPAAGAIAANTRMRSMFAQRTLVARAARRRADQAAAAKGEFLANMSHEIRTPLNGVIGLADALSRSELQPQQRELLKMILASGKALTGLLSDALDLARADSGALRLSIEPLDIRRCVGEAAYLFESIAREKGLDFCVEFDIDTPGAVADSLRVKQIVSNLVSNAVKFTEKGAVTLSTAFKAVNSEEAVLTVTVRDTGLGFDEAVRMRLFQRFEQGDASVTRRYGGSGLGLAIAFRLAKLMGGALSCEGAPGEGATFTLTLPLQIAHVLPAEASMAEAPCLEGGRQLAVLVAEDNHVNQKVIQAMLGDVADLTVVGDGQQAVDAFHARDFDVILMDTHMPVLDGLSAIRRIRAEESSTGSRRVPIISLTADAMPQQIEAAKVAGADLHVAKPITVETLLRALQASVRLQGGERAA